MQKHAAEVDVAVLILFFTRPEPLKKVFDAIRQARPSKLYLYQDGPRGPQDMPGIEACRQVAYDDEIDWECAAILIFCGVSVVASCSKDEDKQEVLQQKEYFTLWNKCDALTALQDYVKDVTDPNSPNFIKEEDRIATFDMDGTFVGELYPTYFEYNMLEYRVLDDASYKDQAPDDVKEAAQDIRDFVRNG